MKLVDVAVTAAELFVPHGVSDVEARAYFNGEIVEVRDSRAREFYKNVRNAVRYLEELCDMDVPVDSETAYELNLMLVGDDSKSGYRTETLQKGEARIYAGGAERIDKHLEGLHWFGDKAEIAAIYTYIYLEGSLPFKAMNDITAYLTANHYLQVNGSRKLLIAPEESKQVRFRTLSNQFRQRLVPTELMSTFLSENCLVDFVPAP